MRCGVTAAEVDACCLPSKLAGESPGRGGAPRDRRTSPIGSTTRWDWSTSSCAVGPFSYRAPTPPRHWTRGTSPSDAGLLGNGRRHGRLHGGVERDPTVRGSIDRGRQPPDHEVEQSLTRERPVRGIHPPPSPVLDGRSTRGPRFLGFRRPSTPFRPGHRRPLPTHRYGLSPRRVPGPEGGTDGSRVGTLVHDPDVCARPGNGDRGRRQGRRRGGRRLVGRPARGAPVVPELQRRPRVTCRLPVRDHDKVLSPATSRPGPPGGKRPGPRACPPSAHIVERLDITGNTVRPLHSRSTDPVRGERDATGA